jgi:hypothetical protein
LREWLEITGYHNGPYRDKILKRRREIAELDAQRSRLVAEIEADERAGIAVTAGPLNTSSVMLAPPLPNKVAVRADPVQKSDAAESEPYRDYVDSIKRSYSDIQDSHDENGLRKTQIFMVVARERMILLRNVPDRVVMTLPVDYRLIIAMKEIRPVLDVTRTG